MKKDDLAVLYTALSTQNMYCVRYVQESSTQKIDDFLISEKKTGTWLVITVRLFDDPK